MKKINFLTSLFLIAIFFACKEKNRNENLETKIESKNKVVFKIDERTEFFRTILILQFKMLCQKTPNLAKQNI